MMSGCNGDGICCKSKYKKYNVIQDRSYESGKSSEDCLSRDDERTKAGHSGDI